METKNLKKLGKLSIMGKLSHSTTRFLTTKENAYNGTPSLIPKFSSVLTLNTKVKRGSKIYAYLIIQETLRHVVKIKRKTIHYISVDKEMTKNERKCNFC
jgi:hypothetical protein